MHCVHRWAVGLLAVLVPTALPSESSALDDTSGVLSGTKPLTMTDDIADKLVEGVDSFLLKQIDESTKNRAKFWNRNFSSANAYQESVEPNRRRLAHVLGLRDPLSSNTADQTDFLLRRDLVYRCNDFSVYKIGWPSFADVTGEGLEAIPNKFSDQCKVDVLVLPDADQSPEQLIGLLPGVSPISQVAHRLVESGCHVIVPALIDRNAMPRNGRATLTNREFIYRPAYELGRHPIGYEVQKVISLVNWLSKPSTNKSRVGVFGYGEGGAIALYAAAIDSRIHSVVVSAYFDDRNDMWRQPIDRNLFGLLEQFGDAEVATLISPRTLIVEAAKGPELVIAPGHGGAPGRLTTPHWEAVSSEVAAHASWWHA